ncbi:hypothetical protein BU17DRAFT_63922 [Hysterangium stoloniferum]|nr:hypothetical protein BU17DRAFT_63922 [Hysterangium stoloniferum]
MPGREPVYLNSDSKLEPSASRGNHEIEHQFQYPTAPGFVFNDSCGYCLPTSNDRGMTDAEMNLFESGTGNAPIIAIFTKMDALAQVARNQLMFNDEELSCEEIEKQVPDLVAAIFQKKYLKLLDEVIHKPRYVLRLRDMNKEGTNCDELIVRTSQALDRDTLKLFCLSILRIDIESRIKQVINE